MNVKRNLVYGAVAASLALTAVISRPLLANAQGGPNGPTLTTIGFSNPCSTTDYTSIAATALGITPTELRVALVSGKSIQDLATEKSVSIDDVNKALDAARQADLAQAQTDGTVPAMPNAPTLPGSDNSPDTTIPGGGNITIRVFGRGRDMGVSAHNQINSVVVAAQAIGVSCPDLVKEAMTGKSIVQVATEKNVQVQTVIDAIVKARKDALAKDVSEGLITQAQADGSSVRLVEEVTQMISRPGGLMMGFGDFNGFGGGFRFGGRVDRNGNGDNQSNGPGRPNRPGRGSNNTPEAPDATPAAPDSTPEATPNA